jgi:hypothetical protein
MSDWTSDDSSTALGFDLGEIDTTPDLLPAGEYPLVVTRASVEPSRNNASTKLAKIEETITDGACKGRKIWSQYVVAHERGEVMARGRRELAIAARAYGVSGGDLAEFVGRECNGNVGIEDGKNGFGDRNKVLKRYPSPASAPKPQATAALKPGAPKPGAAPTWLQKRKDQMHDT